MIAIPFSIAIVSKIIADKPAAVGCFLILLLSRNSSVHSREYSFETERHGGSLQETNFSLASDLTDNSKFKSYDILHKDDEIENDSISSLLMNYRNETVSRSDKLVFLEKTYREKSKERSLQNKNCANTNRYDRKCGKFVPRKGANKCTDNRKFCSCSEKKSFCHFGGTAYCPKCPTTQKLLYCMCPSLPESCKYPWKPNCLNAPPGGECPCQSQWKQCDAGFELECKRVPKYTQKFYYCVCKEKQTLAPSKEPTTPPSLDLSPLVFPSAFPSPRHKKSPTSAPLESSTTPVKSPTNYPVTKSPSVQCQNTEAQFLIKPQKGVYARCRWMARGQNSQRRINNFCHSFTQFEDTNKKTYVCKRCCKICRRCTTCSDVCP